MKLLMTADAVGGVWTYAMELAQALAPHDVDIVLATMGPTPSAVQRRHAARCRNVQLEESTFRLEWMSEPWRDVDSAGEWLLQLEQRHAPDVIHLNGYAHAALPWRAPVVVVAHSCVLSWWEQVRAPAPLPAAWAEYRDRVREGLARAQRVVAPTTVMLNALRRLYDVDFDGVVIANGRGAPFAPNAKEPLVLSAGRAWDEGKNLQALARVAPQLPWPVLIAGPTASPDGARVPRAEGVRWLGRLETNSLASWLGRAAVYALPARYEPFGLSLVEAARSGCALVAGRIPSLVEVWGDAACYADPDDDLDLAVQVSQLCLDRTRRAEMAERARQRSMEFTPDRMGRAYLATYEGLRALPSHGKEEALCVS